MLQHAGPDADPRLSATHLILGWSVSPALVAVLVAAGLYLLGTRALRRRGDAWSARRTGCAALGLLVVAWATSGGLAAYDESYFSVHMAQHMLLAMVAPLLLALGAPVTLALRTLPARPRQWLLGLLHSRAAALLAFPAIGWLLFVGTPFILYFSSLYPATLAHPLLHDWLHLHFLLVGCLFLWPLVGLDPVPGRVAHGFRVLLVLVALPFHAFLGVAIMSRDSLIAADHYQALHRASDAALLADQRLGGGMLWAMGDVIGFVLLVALFAQWMRADERAARRGDRQAERDDDAALAAANARLAELARGGPGSPGR